MKHLKSVNSFNKSRGSSVCNVWKYGQSAGEASVSVYVRKDLLLGFPVWKQAGC